MRPIIVALVLLASVPAQAESIANILDKAWLRLPHAQSQPSREAELNANSATASSLLPAPPALVLGHRTDRFNRNAGEREIEAELSMPLWLPGEKSARQQLAASDLSRFSAEQLALRLQLAGTLREAIWQLELAEKTAEMLQTRLSAQRQIEADVARQVSAGELARADLLLAQGERLAAQGDLAEAEQALLGARQTYAQLVGDSSRPDVPVEPLSNRGELAAHPLLLASSNRFKSAQARARLVAKTGRDNPELSFSARRERGDPAEPFANSLAVSIKIPFGSGSRNASRVAAAQADVTEAEVAFQRQQNEIERAIETAEAALRTAQRRADLAQSRHALAQDNLQLIKKAFSLGEKSLFEFQRAQFVLDQAALAASQAEIAIHHSYARLNQALGVMP